MAADWRFPNFRGFENGPRPFFYRHIPRRRGIQYAARVVLMRGACDHWIVRRSLSLGPHSAPTRWRTTATGSRCRSVDTLKVRDAKDVEQVVRAAIASDQPLEIIGHGSKRLIGQPMATNALLDLSALERGQRL